MQIIKVRLVHAKKLNPVSEASLVRYHLQLTTVLDEILNLPDSAWCENFVVIDYSFVG
jgi:hypothetical protein